MRIIKFEGEIAYLKEKYWKQLIRRFSPTEEELENGQINAPCICKYFSSFCCGCPFEIWKGSVDPGCIEIMRAIFPQRNFDWTRITFARSVIVFDTRKREIMKEQFAKIRRALFKLPKVGGMGV